MRITVINRSLDRQQKFKGNRCHACGRNVQQVVKPFVFIYLHPLSEYFHGIVTCPRPGYTGLVVLVFKKMAISCHVQQQKLAIRQLFLSKGCISSCIICLIYVSQELALLRNIKRTASVVVREDAELLVVEKDVFSKTCPKIFDKELVDKIKFCK